jgi:acetylornithine deacetylase
MKAVAKETGIETTHINSVPGLAPIQDSPAERLALHLSGANGLDAVSYATEAGLFQQIGIPSVICGPGSIEQAHKPDEYVEVAQLTKCEAFMRRLADHCARS